MCPDPLSIDFESDNDSLYVMPLEIIPFETPALTRGRLRLNAGLEHVVDVYSDDRGQHGYIQLNQVTQKDGAQNYGWSPDLDLHPDMAILGKLRNLASFDVFSLRILFRANGIAPKDSNALELSATTKASLSAHLKRFTPPGSQRVRRCLGARGIDLPDRTVPQPRSRYGSSKSTAFGG